MIILRSKTFTCVLTILTFTLNIRMCVQITERTPEGMSSDFKKFLSGLGTMVYKYKKATGAGSDRQRRDEYSYTTSAALPTLISMRDEGIFKTQKAALRDVLMMKLVSYYENKYKITDHVSTTDISVLRGNKIKSVDALNEIKRTQRTPINLKPREQNYEEEVLVI